MRHLVRTTKALADESRIRILGALRENELCVCQLIELLGLAPSTVSKHLSILRNARLIDSRKQGRWMYYRVAGADAPEQIAQVLRWVFETFEKTEQREKDDRRLKEILSMDPEILCSRQPSSNSGDAKTTQG
ncbi:MAG: metalloregulator ArsR/SmtB family transcription factor [Desulfobacterales bacterium]|nr:metalloregulator ArsR/SmtB family transcription factor [Desulfobacterales bacterium]